MGRLISRRIEQVVQKNKHCRNSGIEKETKEEQRIKKKELRKQSAREKDYNTTEEKEFSVALHGIQLKVRYMDGDGNCLFRSIADQLTGKCSDEIRIMVVEYIEVRKDHFSLFMEDDESFEDYIDRMKSFGEWGGHQELYAASQCLHVNIIVHQCSRTAPRFILPCENATRNINLSYHGECHYNSVHHLINRIESQELSEMNKEFSLLSTSVSEKPNLVLVKAVLRALPWTSSNSQVELALKMSGSDVDAAVELLMMNPEGLGDNIQNYSAIDSYSADDSGKVSTQDLKLVPHVNNECCDGNEHSSQSKNCSRRDALDVSKELLQSTPQIKTVRQREKLHNGLSSVVSKLSKKDQRNAKKNPKGILPSINNASDCRGVTPTTTGIGGVREIFL